MLKYAPATGNFITLIAGLIAVVAALHFAIGTEVIIPGIKFAAAIVARPDEFVLCLKFFPGWLWPHITYSLLLPRPEQDVNGEGTALVLVNRVKLCNSIFDFVNQSQRLKLGECG